MRILLVNDDGILAPGLEALYRAVRHLGEVEVVAPSTSQSAMGHAISVRTPLQVQRVHVNNVFHGWSVEGRPADCVKLAMVKLLPQRPDYVISGINNGSNTAINVLYSGTVAGAIEGAFFGIPSVAISLEHTPSPDFNGAAAIARTLIERYLATRPAPGTCLNINIPSLERGAPVGVRVCPQATVPMDDEYIEHEEISGFKVYSLDGRVPHHDRCPATDLAAIHERYVAITPLRFDMTDHTRLRELAEMDWPQRLDPPAAPLVAQPPPTARAETRAASAGDARNTAP